MPPNTIQIAFAGGIDQRTAAEYVDPSGRVLDLVNGRFAHDGSIEKRMGVLGLKTTVYPGNSGMGPARRILSRGAETLATDGQTLRSYSTAESIWSSRGSIPDCVATRQTLFSDTQGFIGFAVAEGNGVRAVVYRNASGANLAGDVFVSLYDIATGAPILVQSQVTSGTIYYNPTPIIIGTKLYLFYITTGSISSTGTLFGNVYDLTTNTWSGPTNIATDTAGMYAATPEVGGPGILIVYVRKTTPNGSSPTYLRLENLPALTVTSTNQVVLVPNNTSTTVVDCRYDGTLNRVWFAWETLTGTSYTLNFLAVDTTWFLIVGPFTPGSSASSSILFMCVEPVTSSTAWIAAPTGAFPITTAGTVGSLVVLSHGNVNTGSEDAVVCSRPFRATSGPLTRLYMLVGHWEQAVSGGQSFATYQLVALWDSTPSNYAFPLPIATVAPRQGNVASLLLAILAGDNRPAIVTPVAGATTTTVRTIVGLQPSEEMQATITPGTTANVFSGIPFLDIVTFDFTGAYVSSSAEGNNETYIATGIPSYYDGAGVQELGFLSWPSGLTNAISSGGTLSSGNYQWAFCFAQLDSQGLIHRSVAWTSASIVITSGQQVTWTIPNPIYCGRFTAGRTPALEVYRTLHDQTTFYYVGAIQLVQGAGNLTFVDGGADVQIQTNATLYTTGGVLDSVCPPSFQHCIRHVSRIWGIDDSGYVVWYSTPFNSGDSPYFNESLTLQFAEEPLTALASVDGNLVCFSSRSIWYVSGSGPNNLGQQSDLVQAVRVPTPAGAADWRSVVVFPGGTFFQAPNGDIHLMDRGYNVTFIGQPVQDLTSGLAIVSATLVESAKEVRFVLSTGTVLTFDYALTDSSGAGRWSRDVYQNFGSGPACATVVNGTTWTAGCSLGVIREKTSSDSAAWYDTNAAGTNFWVTIKITTGYIKPGGLQGFATVPVIQGFGAFLDPCDILVQAVYNYGQTNESRGFAYTALTSSGQSTDAQWMFGPSGSNMTCESVSLVMTDATPTGAGNSTGRGLRWLGVALDAIQLGNRWPLVSPLAKG